MTKTTYSSVPPSLKYMDGNGITLLGIYFLLIGILLIENVILIWPANTQPVTQDFRTAEVQTENPTDPDNKITLKLKLPIDSTYLPKEPLKLKFFFWPSYKAEAKEGIPLEIRYILMTLLIGALGSWLHAVSSFVDFVGNRNFVKSWLFWYLMRPFIGGVLALIFYMILRSGLLPVNVNGEVSVSPYSVAAFAGLAGLFTQRASIKLAEVFDVIFSSTTKYKDPLNKKLKIIKIAPESLVVNQTGSLVVTVEGTDFQNQAKVLVNSVARPSVLQGDVLQVTLAAADVEKEGELSIVVENPNGEKSNALTLKVEQAAV